MLAENSKAFSPTLGQLNKEAQKSSSDAGEGQ
jgi:hypothetical protein